MEHVKNMFPCCFAKQASGSYKVTPSQRKRHKEKERPQRVISSTEEMNPVLLGIEKQLESGDIDIDFPTAPALVKKLLAGAAKELQYPHTFNGSDTISLLYRMLRMILEVLNDIVLAGLGGTAEEQQDTLRQLHRMCHEWIMSRLDRFNLQELANKEFPNGKLDWSKIAMVNHPLARDYDAIAWMFSVSGHRYLRKAKYGIPVLATKQALRVLLLQPPPLSGCAVQFNDKLLDTLMETHEHIKFYYQELSTTQQLKSYMRSISPDVVHFAGDVDDCCLTLHGGEVLYAKELREALKGGSTKPMAIIFNSCTSQIGMLDELAEPDNDGLVPDCVIGTNVGLETKFAVKFSAFFYHALAVGHTFLGAYRIAEDAVAQFIGRVMRIRCKPSQSSVVETRTVALPFYWEGGLKAREEEHALFDELKKLDAELFTFVAGFITRTFKMVQLSASIIAVRDRQEALEDERAAARRATQSNKGRAHFIAAVVSQLELARDNPKYHREHVAELRVMERTYRSEMHSPEDWPHDEEGELRLVLREGNVEELMARWSAALGSEATDAQLEQVLREIDARHEDMDDELRELFDELAEVVTPGHDGDMLRGVNKALNQEVAKYDSLYAAVVQHRMKMAMASSEDARPLQLLPPLLEEKFSHFREWALGTAMDSSVANVHKEFTDLLTSLRLEERLPVHRLAELADEHALDAKSPQARTRYRAEYTRGRSSKARPQLESAALAAAEEVGKGEADVAASSSGAGQGAGAGADA